MSHSSSSGIWLCSINVLPSCGGSGLISYFSNLDNKTEVLDTYVHLNKMNLQGNVNLVPYNDIYPFCAIQVVSKNILQLRPK